MLPIAVCRDGPIEWEIQEGAEQQTPRCPCTHTCNSNREGWTSSAAWAFPEEKVCQDHRQGAERPPPPPPVLHVGARQHQGRQGEVFYTQPHALPGVGKNAFSIMAEP